MMGVLLTTGVGERRPCSTWGVGVTHATRGLGEEDITRPLVEEPEQWSHENIEGNQGEYEGEENWH